MTTQSISSQRKLSIRGKVKEDSQYAESKSLKVIYHYGHFAYPIISKETIAIDLEISFTLPDRGSHQMLNDWKAIKNAE